MKIALVGLGIVASLFSGATVLAQNETRLQLTGSNGNTTVIEPSTLSGNRTITVPDVSGTFFIVPASGGGGTANQLTRFGTTTGTLLNGSLSDNGSGTLSRSGGLTLSVTSLSITGQTAFNVGSGGAFSMPTATGRLFDALTNDGGATTAFTPVPPVGTVSMFAGSSAPGGYLLCDGAAYNIVDYPDLHNVIGTTYGSAGAGTFRVPDLRNRNVIGAGSRALGATGGAESHTLTTSELPAHNHGVTDPGHGHTINDPGHNHGLNIFAPDDFNWSAQNGQYPSADGIALANAVVTGTNTTGITINTNTTGISTQNAGGGNAHNIMDPYLILNFIIKY